MFLAAGRETNRSTASFIFATIFPFNQIDIPAIFRL